jgi:hypothetical protein
MIANSEPTTHCQIGISAGRLRANSNPVTAADRSPTVCSLFVIILKSASNPTELIIQTNIGSNAFKPKITHPATVTGRSAMSTSAIILDVLLPL